MVRLELLYPQQEPQSSKGLAEKYTIVATNAGTSPSQSITDGNVIKFTGNETGSNTSLNISDVNTYIQKW